jgi:hypothetical protein
LGAKRESSRHLWSEVKTAIVGLGEKQLIKLISDLYSLSRENQTFLHARFTTGGDTLDPYKKIIEASMYPDVYRNKPVEVSKAKKAISSYSKAVGDPFGVAELMVFFVECGNSFTVDFGDMDEGFYDALNRMYRRAINEVLSLPEEEQDRFRERLEEIMTSSSNIGWGYHDMLWEDYYEAFPDETGAEPVTSDESAPD